MKKGADDNKQARPAAPCGKSQQQGNKVAGSGREDIIILLPHVCRTNLYRQAIDAYQKHTAARAWFENKTKAKEESKENKAEEVGGAWYLYILYGG